MQLTLPESIFGLAIAEPINLDRHHDGNFIYFGEIFKAYLMLAMTYLVQVLFMWELWKVDEEKAGDECKDKYLYMQLMCSFVFQIAIFAEVRDALLMMLVIWEQPSAAWQFAHRGTFQKLAGNDGTPKAGDGGAIMQKEDSSKRGQLARAMKLKGKLDVKQWSLDGMSRFMKVWSIAVICIPRFMASLLLAYIGSIYITRSGSSEDMFLNTMAVNFVLEIGAIFYSAFTSDHTKESFQNLDPVEVEVGNKRRAVGWFMSTFVYPSVVFFLSIWTVLATKTYECDGYEKPWPRFVLMLKKIVNDMDGGATKD